MNSQEKQQIKSIIANFESTKKIIPFLSDLEQHPAFWPLFVGLWEKEKEEINLIIDEYILEKLELIKKTKGGQLFARFAEANPDLFWDFRRMNDSQSQDADFQKLWAQVETEMFKLEGILTERMLKQEKGLEKVVESFQNLIYSFFPRFNEVE